MNLVIYAAITVSFCWIFFHLGVWGTRRHLIKHAQNTPFAEIFDKAVSYLEKDGYIRTEMIDGVQHIIPIETLLERERKNNGRIKTGEEKEG